jgi:predicted ATPase
MLSWELRSCHEAGARPGPVIFDRAVPVVIGYLRLCGLPVRDHALKATRTFRYAPRMFVAPPWRKILAAEADRKQDFAEAEATHAAMVETYTGLGYELVPLPFAPVADRRSRPVRHQREG